MESGDIAKVLLAAVALFGVAGKTLHYLVTTLISSQVDRLIDAGNTNNRNADERHLGTQNSLKKVAKALRRLKRKKCSARASDKLPSLAVDSPGAAKVRKKKTAAKS